MLKGPDVIAPEGATELEEAAGVGASAGCAAGRVGAAIGSAQTKKLRASNK
jgi:hypothetical protein